MNVFTFLIGLIPGVGPIFAAATGVITSVFKPAATIASAVEQDAAAAIKTVLANAALREAILVGVLVFGVMHEQGVIKGLKARLVDPATGKTWQVEAVSAIAAFNQERRSFQAVDSALVAQNGAVEALGRLGEAKLANSAQIGSSVAPALAAAHSRSAPVLATQTGATALDRALATDAAFLKVIP